MSKTTQWKAVIARIVTRNSRWLATAALLTAPGLLGAKGCGLVTVGSECGGNQGVECGAGLFCDYAPKAQCGAADQTGTCAALPQQCATIYAPVCGCDDKTYGNECEANAAGVSVAASGACDAPTDPGFCGGIAGVACAEEQFCNFPIDTQCGAGDQTGSCETLPDVCREEYAPVCGCDGKTYSNDCFANSAGVSVAAQGECADGEPEPEPGTDCGGLQGLTCADGQFCDFTPQAACGKGDQLGTCTAMPELCTQQYDPVCGCDGKTYGNACSAHSAGVAIAADGECAGSEPDPTSACGGLLGLACKDGEFCSFAADALCGAADQTGTCLPIPDACDTVYAPVCGCDDKTYGNECEANAAGISMASSGECAGSGEPTPGSDCGGLLGLACAKDEFCNYPIEAQCGAADQTGTCTPVPQGCSKEYQPVCGCDGVTYGNACTASAAGVSVASEGECKDPGPDPSDKVCGGLLGTACADGEFCAFAPDAQCGAADQTGVCRVKPEVCAELYAPVCGCDDVTYGNACEANGAGVSVAYDGACSTGDGGTPAPSGACGGLRGASCASGQFCNFSIEAMCGAADQTGVCTVIPEGCIALYDPVCGCDGKTYGNECEANAAEVSVVSAGPCE